MPRNVIEYHPLIGYRFIPKIKVRVEYEKGGYLIKTNNLGFRCENDVTKKNHKGTFRILLFGDSFTAGDGVSNKYRYGDLLENYFKKIEILNFGLSGSGTDQQYLIYKEYCQDLEYDLLLICPMIENIRRNIAGYRISLTSENKKIVFIPKPYFKIENKKLVLYHNPVPRNILDYKDIKNNPKLSKYIDKGGRFPKITKIFNKLGPRIHRWVQKLIRYQPFPEYNSKNNPAWLLMKMIIKEWVDGMQKVLICPIPTYQHIERISSPKKYKQRFSELENEIGIKIIDILPRFWMESKETRLNCRFQTDPHPTPLGHIIIADGLKPYIEGYYRRWLKTV